ncbi:MAG: T9SS type A sorting domain-containing protein [Tannerella sp.]|jgi:hypothetical protein|nr:T9SS type A sorting domain-containing protein [Tannerella sp.]
MKKILASLLVSMLFAAYGMAEETPFTISYSFESDLEPALTPVEAPFRIDPLRVPADRADITFEQATEEGSGVLKVGSWRTSANAANALRLLIKPQPGVSFTVTGISLRHKKGENALNFAVLNISGSSTIQSEKAIPDAFESEPYEVSIFNNNYDSGLELGFVFRSDTYQTYAYWFIDEIIIEGTYEAGDVTEDIILSKSTSDLTASAGCAVVDSIRVMTAGFTTPLDLTFSGNNASLFSVLPETLTADEAEDGKWVYITYSPTHPGSHSATLTIGTSTTSQDVEITGTTHLLYENFNKITQAQGDANIDLADGLLADYLSTSTGWTYSSLYTYRTSAGEGGVEIKQSPGGSEAFLSTPPLDLSRPFTLSFKSRKVDGDAPVYVRIGDSGTPVFSVNALTNSLAPFSLPSPLTAGNGDVITFYTNTEATCRVVVDDITVNYVDNGSGLRQGPAAAENCILSVEGKTVRIQTSAPQTVYVYNSTGQIVRVEATQENSAVIALPQPGLYLLRVAGRVYKVII